MDHDTYLAHIVEQAEALRAAAIAAGPTAPVPSCPKWTVSDLVAHIAGVHAWVAEALTLASDAPRPTRPNPPEDWDELLTWWDGQRTTMLGRLAEDPAQQAWTFFPGAGTVGWWGRRQAHETAIHRLDAELANTEKVPTLLFDSELAADGIDEVLQLSAHRARLKRPELTVEGTVLVHAADAGRAWIVHAHQGELTVGPVEDSATDADATLVGTADAVYRAAWGRPSTALASGRTEIMEAINGG